MSVNGGCFAPGTKINLPGGVIKNIEEIQVGDSVMTYNMETKTYEPHDVIGTYVHHHTPRMIMMRFTNGSVISATPDHPLLCTKGWRSRNVKGSLDNYGVEVQRLEFNKDIVIGLHDTKAWITEVDELSIGPDYDSYDIEVDTGDTFIAEGIVFYNCKREGTQ